MENNRQYTAKEENSKTPKNIRQIGVTEAGKAVYVEDYVITFLNKLSKEDKSSMQAAVLLGTFQRTGNRQTYVEGAVGITDYVCGEDNRIHFTETKWTEILEEMKQSFPGLEIVGWFLSAEGWDKPLEERLLTLHKEQFREPDSILFYMDTVEGEEKIFRNENGVLKFQGGYYIYYEKNRAMQEYMVRYFGERAEETNAQVPDKAARQFRRMVQEKETQKVKKSSGMSYAFATFALLVVFAIGMSVLDNYEKLSYVEQEVKSLTTQVSAMSDGSTNTRNSTTPSDDVMTSNMGDSKGEVTAGSDIGVEDGVIGSDVETTVSDDSMTTSEANLTQDEVDETTEDGESEVDAESEIEETLQNSKAEDVEDNTQEATPQASPSPTETAEIAAQTMSIEGKQAYIVEQGDTLEIISMKIYQTTDKVDEIRELNQIVDPNKILVGEKIWLP